jgi:hypothetical protein
VAIHVRSPLHVSAPQIHVVRVGLVNQRSIDQRPSEYRSVHEGLSDMPDNARSEGCTHRQPCSNSGIRVLAVTVPKECLLISGHELTGGQQPL